MLPVQKEKGVNLVCKDIQEKLALKDPLEKQENEEILVSLVNQGSGVPEEHLDLQDPLDLLVKEACLVDVDFQVMMVHLDPVVDQVRQVTLVSLVTKDPLVILDDLEQVDSQA